MSAALSLIEAPADYLAWEAQQARPEFTRTVERVRKLKTLLDCGHWIDCSSLYRYHVSKHRGEPLFQRTDCEDCARVDSRF